MQIASGKGLTDQPARAVFLVGFMGAGKTSVGRDLARRLDWTFEDLDDRVVQREGRSIAEIFRDLGEPAFRQAEHAALQDVLEESRLGIAKVIALGGGAFAQSENSALLRSAGVATVFLTAPIAELWDRCGRQAAEEGLERPLLQSMQQFQALYESRKRAYSQASTTIETSGRTISEISAAIAQTLKLKRRTVRAGQGERQ